MVIQYDEQLTGENDDVCQCYVVDWEVPEGDTTSKRKSELTDTKVSKLNISLTPLRLFSSYLLCVSLYPISHYHKFIDTVFL